MNPSKNRLLKKESKNKAELFNSKNMKIQSIKDIGEKCMKIKERVDQLNDRHSRKRRQKNREKITYH